MSKSANLCRFAILLTCLLGLRMDAAAQPLVGSAAPNFTLNFSNGGSFTLSSLLGEVVHLNFFGATCGDCIADGLLSEEIYDLFATNTAFNIIGIDVWNLPAAYVNTTFRTNSGITYPLLVQGRNTAIAYNMEVNPVPSTTDIEHRGHVIIDQQGIIRYYAIYNPFDETQQAEMICVIKNLLGIAPPPPQNAAIIRMDEFGPLKLCWQPAVEPEGCDMRYLVFKSFAGDWSDEEFVTSTFETAIMLTSFPDSTCIFHVVAERQMP
ncbi:TlpA family protein disulfide reductase [bacterium]|nr:TlpA family protein disulfide reductase [bacterium]